MTKDTLEVNTQAQDQFTLSIELLRLLQWLVEHDSEGLKRLINKAFAHGLNEKIQKPREVNANDHNEIQHSIIDFFVVLEALLFEALNDSSVKSVIQRNLIPSVNRIDTSAFDTSTLKFSLERATAQLSHNSKSSPRDVLMKELIKRWKPNKKNGMN
jgi:hypothetical protein